MINGKFRTPKIEALHRLINWLNNKDKFEILKLLPLNNSDIFRLAGFSDSDANFYFSYSIKENALEYVPSTKEPLSQGAKDSGVWATQNKKNQSVNSFNLSNLSTTRISSVNF